MNCSFCNREIIEDASYCPHCGTAVEGSADFDDSVYEAFISYRHLPLDRQVAVKIQKAIEGFRVPKQIVAAYGTQRLGKCFRDEDELPTSASLSEQIEDALKRSRFLIVVCTKNTRDSLWVQREVELFASYHGRDRILVALAEGEPSESFPELLLTRVEQQADGSFAEVPREPIAADFRDLKRAKFDVEKLRIISSLIGCNYDDLRQRAKSRRNKIIATGASIVTAVSLAFGGVSTYQQAQLTEAYKQIQVKESEFLATEANDLLAQGDRYQAVQVALAALPLAAESEDRPYVPAAQMALEQSLGVYPGASCWQSSYSETDISKRYGGNCVTYSGTGLEAYFTIDNLIEIRETATGNLVSSFEVESALERKFSSGSTPCATAFLDDKLVAVVCKCVACFDVNDGSLLWKQDFDWLSYDRESLAISPDSEKIAVVDETMTASKQILVHILNADDGTLDKTIEFPGYQESHASASTIDNKPSVAFSDDGSHLVFGTFGYVYLVDIASGTYTRAETIFGNTGSVEYFEDLIVAISEDSTSSYTSIPTGLDVYDLSLNHLWSYRQTIEPPYDESGRLHFHIAEVCGSWSFHRGDDRQLVVAYGNKLLLLDKQTGEEAFSADFSIPIIGCTVEQARNAQRIFIGLGDGSLKVRIPYESNSGKGGTVSDIKFDTGMVQDIDFVPIDGHVYCSLVTNYPAKRMVYRFIEADDFIDNVSLCDSYGMSDIKHFSWEGDFIAIRNDEAVAFIDPQTYELLSRVDLATLDKLDLEKQYNFEAEFDAKGNYYLLGNAIKEEGDSIDKMALYRINYPDGTVDPLFTIATSSIYDFSIAEFEDKSTQVLLTGRINYANHILAVNPDLEGDDRLTYDCQIDNCWKTWYANGHFIVHINDSNEKYDTFKLVDVKTGDEIDCDLSRYCLSSTTTVDMGVSISDDKTRLAMACSDGYLRLFETMTGKLLWETSQVSKQIRFVKFGESGDLFVQDTFGSCSLVSGVTGMVLKTTSTALPPITQGYYQPGTNRLNLLFTGNGLFGRQGLLFVSMDPEMFGPSSIIYGGINISKDEKLFTYIDDYTDDFCAARMFSLDELILQGHELVLGHELSDSEKLQYQVGDQLPKK